MRAFAIGAALIGFFVILACVVASIFLGAAAMSVGTVVSANQFVGSGHLITKDYAISDFTSVSINSAFNAEIVQGETFSVSVTADDNLFDYLHVEKQGSTLRIYFDPRDGRFWGWSVRPNTLRAKITMPTLEAVDVNGASNVNITGFKSGKDFTADVSGASRLNGVIEAGNVRIETSGASRASLTGSGTTAVFRATGASHLDLESFSVEDASVTLEGASSGTVSAKTKLSYNLSGASNLRYVGNPTIGARETQGASSAKHR